MTQEEKARAYDKALKRAKQMFSEKELNYLFPELQESEDERIRKAIHIYLDWLDGRNKNYQPKGDYSIRDMIAWLEKQAPKPKWTEEDDKMLDKIINALIGAKNVDCADYSIMYDWLNLIEQRIGV